MGYNRFEAGVGRAAGSVGTVDNIKANKTLEAILLLWFYLFYNLGSKFCAV